MTFDEWLDEFKGWACRREYILADCESSAADAKERQRLFDWLKAAYDVGFLTAKGLHP